MPVVLDLKAKDAADDRLKVEQNDNDDSVCV